MFPNLFSCVILTVIVSCAASYAQEDLMAQFRVEEAFCHLPLEGVAGKYLYVAVTANDGRKCWLGRVIKVDANFPPSASLVFRLSVNRVSGSCPEGIVLQAQPETGEGGTRYVYFAVQEAAFARAQFAEWLAKALLAMKLEGRIEWYVCNTKRENNQVKLIFGLCVNGEGCREWTTSFHNEGTDGLITPVVRVLEDRVMVELVPDVDGITRHLVVMQAKDVSVLKEKLGASRLRPGWKWEPILFDSNGVNRE